MQNIKNIALLIGLCAMAASCVTTSETSKTLDYRPEAYSVTVADLKVSDKRVDYTMSPVPKDIRRGGEHNVKKAAEYEALKKGGEGDVLVEPEYVISKKRTLFGSKITSITVTGRPATYVNFRSLNDSVWNNPVFRGRPNYIVKGSSSATKAMKKQSSKSKTPKEGNDWLGFKAMISIEGSSSGAWKESAWEFAGMGNDFVGGANATLGSQLNNNLFVGGGVGFIAHGQSETWDLPIYAAARWNFVGAGSMPNLFPFVDLKVGYAVTLDSGDYRGGLGTELSNQFYLSPSVGLTYRMGKCALDVAVQITGLQGSVKPRHTYNDDFSARSYSYGLRLGLQF